MTPFSLKLQTVRIFDILGTSDRIDTVDGPGFKAQFKAEFTTPITNIKKGSTFSVKLTFTGKQELDSPPFFVMSVGGDFEVIDEDAIPVILSETGSYAASFYLFPFVRSLCVPILEHLAEADIEFPFFMPPPPESKPAKKKAAPKAIPAHKAPAKRPAKKEIPAS